MECHKIKANFRPLLLIFYLFFIYFLSTHWIFFFLFCFSILPPFFPQYKTTDYIVARRFDWKIFSLERAFYGWKVATINLFIFLFYSLTLLFFFFWIFSFFFIYILHSLVLHSPYHWLVYLLSPFQAIVETRYNFFFLCFFFSAFLKLEKKNAIWQAEKRRPLKNVERLHFFFWLQYIFFSSFSLVAVVFNHSKWKFNFSETSPFRR